MGKDSLLSLLEEVKILGFPTGGKTEHMYEWTCLLVTSLTPGKIDGWKLAYQERD